MTDTELMAENLEYALEVVRFAHRLTLLEVGGTFAARPIQGP